MSDKRALEVPATHRPAATLSNVKGKRDAPSLPANVTCLHRTQTNRSEPTMCVSGMPGGAFLDQPQNAPKQRPLLKVEAADGAYHGDDARLEFET